MPADAARDGDAPAEHRRISSGLVPLDRHLGGLTPGGLTPGGLYLLSGGEVDTRHYLSLSFLQAGLAFGGTAALVTQVPRDHLLRRLRQWDLPAVAEAWRNGRLRVSGYRGGYEHRVRNAGDPGAVFDELERRVGVDVDRVALVPGRPLWEGALGPMITEAFMDWTARVPATVWATYQRTEGDPSDDERLHHAAAGVFQLTEDARGGSALRILKTPGADLESATLPIGDALREIGGRASDELPRIVLMRPPESEVGESLTTIRGWLRNVAETRELEDPADMVDVLQEDPGIDAVVVFAAQDGLKEAVRACRLASSVGRAPVVAVVGGRVRAADHARLMRAGADECLSAPVNLSVFATRLERLVPGEGRFDRAPGGREADGDIDAPGGEGGGSVSEETFRARLERGLSRHPPEVFTVVRFPREDLPAEAEERLSEAVRLEDGDLVGPVEDGVAVYLAGTSPEEAEGFLRRLASSHEGLGDRAELLGSMRDADALRRLAGDG